MTNHYEYCRKIIAAATSDDLERCVISVLNMGDAELDQQCGVSGRTHRQILQERQEERELNNAALEWLKLANRALTECDATKMQDMQCGQ
jgi:hypothetical protein